MRLQNPSTRVSTWHDKYPSFLKDRRCRAICSPSPAMVHVTSSHAQNILEQDDKQNFKPKKYKFEKYIKKTPYHQITS